MASRPSNVDRKQKTGVDDDETERLMHCLTCPVMRFHYTALNAEGCGKAPAFGVQGGRAGHAPLRPDHFADFYFVKAGGRCCCAVVHFSFCIFLSFVVEECSEGLLSSAPFFLIFFYLLSCASRLPSGGSHLLAAWLHGAAGP